MPWGLTVFVRCVVPHLSSTVEENEHSPMIFPLWGRKLLRNLALALTGQAPSDVLGATRRWTGA